MGHRKSAYSFRCVGLDMVAVELVPPPINVVLSEVAANVRESAEELQWTAITNRPKDLYTCRYSLRAVISIRGVNILAALFRAVLRSL
jgi:Chitin synthase N-terminal